MLVELLSMYTFRQHAAQQDELNYTNSTTYSNKHQQSTDYTHVNILPVTTM